MNPRYKLRVLLLVFQYAYMDSDSLQFPCTCLALNTSVHFLKGLTIIKKWVRDNIRHIWNIYFCYLIFYSFNFIGKTIT